jgi:hypothetical protein
MLPGLFKILNIPESVWAGLLEDYKEIVSTNILTVLVGDLTDEKKEEFEAMLANSQDPGKSIANWITSNQVSKETEEKLTDSFVKSTVDYINAILGGAKNDIRQLAAGYIKEYWEKAYAGN